MRIVTLGLGLVRVNSEERGDRVRLCWSLAAGASTGRGRAVGVWAARSSLARHCGSGVMETDHRQAC